MQQLCALFGGAGRSVHNLTLVPNTPMNVSVTQGRAFAAVTLPLPEIKALGKAHGATINDMVLAVCSSALRRRTQVSPNCSQKSSQCKVQRHGSVLAGNEAVVLVEGLRFGVFRVDKQGKGAHMGLRLQAAPDGQTDQHVTDSSAPVFHVPRESAHSKTGHRIPWQFFPIGLAELLCVDLRRTQ
jgi:Wax ester synthase-like Acyl-CoA acyltransferase domain